MDDRFNTIAGWVLFAGIVALGSSIVAGEYFHSERPEKMGYPIAGVEQAGEPAAAEQPIEVYLAKADPEPRLWINPTDAAARSLADGDAIRIFNDRGAMQARAQVTDRVPAGVVWMRDGWAGINTLTNGGRAVPDAAAKAFPGGQAAYEARVEVSSSGR